MNAYIITILIMMSFCLLLIGIFYLLIKRQIKNFKQYLHEELIKTINDINESTQDIAINTICTIKSDWRGYRGKN